MPGDRRVGLATLTAMLDPEVIVIGGGVAEAGEILLDPVRRSLARRLYAREHRTLPDITQAALGSQAGWVGAAILALDATPAR